LYAAAANQGYAQGQFNYGYGLWLGRIAEPNKRSAFNYFRLAALQGYGNAMLYLSRCYSLGEGGVSYNPVEGNKLLELARKHKADRI